MAKIRVHKTSDYTLMSNRALRDKTLSYKAKGLMSVMLGLPDGWNFSIAGLAALSNVDGRDSVLSGLKELELTGYVKRSRKHDDLGKFAGYDYDIFESPQAENPQPQTDIPQPQTGLPFTEKPSTGKPLTEKPQQLNKQISIKQELNKQEIRERDTHADKPRAALPVKFTKPTISEIAEYISANSLNANASAFYDYFESNGWLVGGKTAMKDWQAAVRNWSRREFGKSPYKTTPQREVYELGKINTKLREVNPDDI